jgi:uncharacterized protein (DUF305 family)
VLSVRYPRGYTKETACVGDNLNSMAISATLHCLTGSPGARATLSCTPIINAQLENATGSEAKRIFLTGMIAHHQSAISMAKMVLTQGRDLRVEHLAEHIAGDQKAEITVMNMLLKR